MINLQAKKGTTSKIIMITVFDASSSVGDKLSTLVYNSAGLTAYYNRAGAAGSAQVISLVTATKGTWVSGGFKAVDSTNMPGDYELHLPDAVLASGADSVKIQIQGATNMVPVDVWIDLIDSEGVKKNTAYSGFEFLMVDATDGITPETGLVAGVGVTATRSIDGGSFSACTNAVAEVSGGIYKIDLSTTDLNGSSVMLKFASSSARTAYVLIKTVI